MENDSLTITLTGRPPVKVDKSAWPILAEASDHLYDGQYDFQSFRHTRGWLKVRQHADGRAIVYGLYEYDTAYLGSRSETLRRGRLVPAGDSIPEAIASVAGELDEARDRVALGDHYSDEIRPFARLAQECIASLPSESL